MIVREYFPNDELTCRCGCGLLPDIRAVEALYAVRIIFGVPLVITSAARCVAHNKASRGRRGSIHLPEHDRRIKGGGAFDIALTTRVKNHLPRLIEICKQCGFLGFGYGGIFIHIDNADRKTLTEWTY